MTEKMTDYFARRVAELSDNKFPDLIPVIIEEASKHEDLVVMGTEDSVELRFTGKKTRKRYAVHYVVGNEKIAVVEVDDERGMVS